VTTVSGEEKRSREQSLLKASRLSAEREFRIDWSTTNNLLVSLKLMRKKRNVGRRNRREKSHRQDNAVNAALKLVVYVGDKERGRVQGE